MIYSKELGQLHVVDSGVDHLLYTVPAGQGPAIVRSLSMATDGALIRLFVWCLDPAGGGPYALGAYDAAAAGWEVSNLTMYQPLAPSSEIHATNYGSAGEWSVSLGGYQFSQP